MTVYGGLKVTTGPTSDSTVQLARLYVGGGLTVQGGAGRNQVWLDDVNVAGLTLIDLGAGDDGLWVEQTAGNSGGAAGRGEHVRRDVHVQGRGRGRRADAGDRRHAGAGDPVRRAGGPDRRGRADTLVVGTGTTFEVTGNLGDFDTKTGAVVK